MSNDFSLTYRVCPASPEAHLFAVELSVPSPPPHGLTLTLPAWIPGSYLIRDFARHIVAITAEDAFDRLVPEKLDKQTWHVPPGRGRVVVRYSIYAGELSVRAAHLDTTHAYFNGTSLFLRVVGRDRDPCRVDLAPPPGEGYRDWRVATSLRRLDAEPFGFGSYYADDYADLIDHPVEMGRFRVISFAVAEVPHWMAITGRHYADERRLVEDLQRVCAQHAQLFGELPVDRYLFLTTVIGDGYGGLEHGYSSSLLCPRDDLPEHRDGAAGEGYRRFLGLCSHEYFHLWNVKRIRPQALSESDLSREVHTRTLWAFEGITSYYDDLALVRCGCIDERAYLGLLAENLSRVMRNPGRKVQSVAASSFDTWTKFYKQDENSPNAIVSYYAKGALVALALDLKMRRESQGARSLDDLMRALWERHGRTGVGVAERGVETLASEIAGCDLGGFFEGALDGTCDLDLGPLLADVGIAMRLRPARGSTDLGGLVERFDEQTPQMRLGVRLQPRGAEPVVLNVLSDSAAERAGIAPGDTLLAVDGLRVTPENLDALVARAADAGQIIVHAFRRDELMTFDVQPMPASLDICELRLIAEASAVVVARRAAWLGQGEGLR
ncbi:putative protease with the C-terminal PDZ domain [Thioflavicoccus mobilis 8321]|uniref:Putative protease with the C-terminal PDZ domain n=1 Tax=Thioflavicoccus mobilis 8321 TaxID=765912 RepID=L0GUG4_9GAMM|nr:PDZ domain-containing protein [Thioflavicoccus mobilis]AGA88980.1 putative protease with the C-terminal PDZ domain [Thioflavicoccus mobilis 8321]